MRCRIGISMLRRMTRAWTARRHRRNGDLWLRCRPARGGSNGRRWRRDRHRLTLHRCRLRPWLDHRAERLLRGLGRFADGSRWVSTAALIRHRRRRRWQRLRRQPRRAYRIRHRRRRRWHRLRRQSRRACGIRHRARTALRHHRERLSRDRRPRTAHRRVPRRGLSKRSSRTRRRRRKAVREHRDSTRQPRRRSEVPLRYLDSTRAPHLLGRRTLRPGDTRRRWNHARAREGDAVARRRRAVPPDLDFGEVLRLDVIPMLRPMVRRAGGDPGGIQGLSGHLFVAWPWLILNG